MLAWLHRNAYVVMALAGALLLAGLAADSILLPEDEPVLVLREGSAAPGGPIRVHVAGAVALPGVYTLSAGDRVADAIVAAGGAQTGADLDAINLARPVRDGEQIHVEGPEASPPLAFAPAPGELLDLNLATQDQLIALPGIGEAYSRRIVDSRTVDGPFASVDEVLERGLVPARTLDGIRPMVTVSAP